MTFERAVVAALSGYVRFDGRAPRSEFWWFQLFCLLMYVAAICLGSLLWSDGGAAGLFLLTWLGLFLPWIALAVRRLHDAGLAGWWLLISFVPLGWVAVLIMLCLGPDHTNIYGPVGGASPKGAPPNRPAVAPARQIYRTSVPKAGRRR